MEDMFHIQVQDKLLGQDWLQSFATTILDSKYKWTDVADVVDKQTHLNIHQKADLLQVLCKNKKMFNVTLGVYLNKKVHIDIDPDAKPLHTRPYPVPHIHLSTFKKEAIKKLGIITQQQSKWASPIFIVPKKMVVSTGLATFVD